MHDFRTKDLNPISPYELKDFLETVFSRETAEYIIECDTKDTEEKELAEHPQERNQEYLWHLCENYDSSDARGRLEEKIDRIKASLSKVKSKNPEFFKALADLDDLYADISELGVVY